jgi:tRNA threonylcarbamoyladenosine biosynthesis protein TsaB
MITLVLEASTYAGSTALLRGNRLLGDRAVAMRGREHEALMPAVAELLAAYDVTPERITRVICGEGPGAFTSLRVAGSIAKGIALASGAQLIPVSSLALLAASHEPFLPGRFLAAMDAMRGEHYVQLFDVDPSLEVRAVGERGIVPSSSLADLAVSSSALLIGPQQSGAGAVIPLARSAARITKMIRATNPADLASWEPGYGRLAEAQVKWEATHGRPLAAG